MFKYSEKLRDLHQISQYACIKKTWKHKNKSKEKKRMGRLITLPRTTLQGMDGKDQIL